MRDQAVSLLERRLAKRPNPGHFWEHAWRGAAEGEPSEYQKRGDG
jgi:hypothetical protein